MKFLGQGGIQFIQVAPARGRGLKFPVTLQKQHLRRVAPARGRGLKCQLGYRVIEVAFVAPARGRGLK